MAGPGAKETADELISIFGTLGSVLGAAETTIAAYAGRSVARQLQHISDAMKLVLKRPLLGRPQLPNSVALREYLLVAGGHSEIEQIRVLYLNAQLELIHETVTDGTIDQAPIYVREVIKRGLNVGATGILLNHNHPSGDPRPSTMDKRFTHLLCQAGRLVGIDLHDHVITAGLSWFSMREESLI